MLVCLAVYVCEAWSSSSGTGLNSVFTLETTTELQHGLLL